MSNSLLPALADFQEDWKRNKGSDLFNPNALDLNAALDFMRHYTLARLSRLKSENIPLEHAFGRVLAKDVIATMNVPLANNSAMDGYAFHSSVLDNLSKTIRLQLIGKQLAGDPLIEYQDFQTNSQAIQITTGALLPGVCDTVIPQEWVIRDGDYIEFEIARISAFENCRWMGEDLRIGELVLPKGRKLQASDMGMIASMGFGYVDVFQTLKVGIFSTGNEITPVGSPLSKGAIYDSNRYTLTGLLQSLPCEIIDYGIIKDHPIDLKNAFAKACNEVDIIITSGGVSVGEADFTKQVMSELGDVAFWTLAIKPGRPMAFGKIHQASSESILFGLPGNPVAVMITFLQFVKPMIEYLSGSSLPSKKHLVAKLTKAIKKKKGRTEFLRAKLSNGSNGELLVEPYKNQGSGVLSSMSQADCLIVLPPELSIAPEGLLVAIETIL